MSKQSGDVKVGFFKRLQTNMARWFREMRSELKKVVWPTPKQLLNNTIIVIVSVLIIGTIIGALDYVIVLGLDALRNAF